MKKKIISILLSLAMVVTMMPAMALTAFAVEPETNCTGDHTGWTAVTNQSGFPTTAGDYKIYLNADVTFSSAWVVPAGTTKLCLNGHVIKANGNIGNLININADTILNLYDCDNTTEHFFTEDANTGLWTLTNTETENVITGGVITGGTGADSKQRAGAVYNLGNFNMYGGTIVGNSATIFGGGVFLAGNAKMTMEGGAISHNYSGEQGGAIYTSGANNILTMNGGSISYNAANGIGGGICNTGTFTMNGGEITGNKNVVKNASYGELSVGGGVHNQATMIMTGGTIKDNTAKHGGGISNGYNYNPIYVMTGTLTITGGIIDGNKSTIGGGIYNVYTGTTLTLNDAKIINNEVISDGGGISLQAGTSAVISNSTITGNTCGNNGMQIHNAGTADKATIKEYCTIDKNTNDLYNVTNNITKTHVTFDKQNGTSETVTADATYNVAMPAVTIPTRDGYTFTGYFDASAGGTKYYNASGASTRNWDKIVANQTLYAHWIEKHVHDNIEFLPWTEASLPTTAGNWYLTEDVTLSSTWNVPAGTTNLCMNGHSIKQTANANVINVGSATLNLYDGNETAEHYFNYVKNGTWTFNTTATDEQKEAAIEMSEITDETPNNTLIKVYGGIITGGKTNKGSGVYVGSGTLNIKGGNIVGCNSNTNGGGGVYIDNSGKFNMSAGAIAGCVGNDGGGVYINTGGKFIMSADAVICNNVSPWGGGGVCALGDFDMNDGTIRGCSGIGGGVFLRNGTFNMKNGDITKCITKADSIGYGGGVDIESGTFNMDGGTISECKSVQSNGGGVYITNSNAIFNMSGGQIIDCKAAIDGGGVYNSAGTFTMKDNAAISNNTSEYSGGGIYVLGGNFNMNGGSFIGNVSNTTVYGGGAVCAAGGTTNLNAGIIKSNISKHRGGGVDIYGGITNINGVSITDNEGAANFGGGVYLGGGTLNIGKNTIITDNKVGDKEQNLYLPNGKTIALSTGGNAPTEGMKVGVTMQSGTGKFTGTATESQLEYFHSDVENYIAKYNTSNYLELVQGYIITNNAKQEDAKINKGYVTVQKCALNGETITITATANAGYIFNSENLKVTYNNGTVKNCELTQDATDETKFTFTMPAFPVTVSATFEPKEFEITFDSNGHGTAPSPITGKYDHKINRPNDPVVAGYILDGWYKEGECINRWHFNKDVVKEETTLYAKWIQVSEDQTADRWIYLESCTDGQTIGESGQTKYYYITEDTSCNAKTAGGSGLSIADGATVYIYIPADATLTCKGADGSGRIGGGAGIHVPASAKLCLHGEGKVDATGGKAGNGGNGENGSDSCNYDYPDVQWFCYGNRLKAGAGGTGGFGGGGAGAGIGTPGAMGPDGGAGGADNISLQLTDYGNLNTISESTGRKDGDSGKQGGDSVSADVMGTLNCVSTVTINATGGNGGSGGGNGEIGAARWFNADCGKPLRYSAGASGGGGGGGGGYAAANIGQGGNSGAGGGGGGSGAYLPLGGVEYFPDLANMADPLLYGNAGGGGGGVGNEAGATGAGIQTRVRGYQQQGGAGGASGIAGSVPVGASAESMNGLTYDITFLKADNTVYSTLNYIAGKIASIDLPNYAGYSWKNLVYGIPFRADSELSTPLDDIITGSINAKNIYGNLIFKAVPNKYTFTLDKNGGYGGDASVVATFDAEIPTITPPSRGSKNFFNGYWDKKDRKIISADGTSSAICDVTANAILEACWESTQEVSDVKTIDESLTGTAKIKAEEAMDGLNIVVGDDNNDKNLERFYTRPDGDILSHHLYFKTTVLGASEEKVNLDIKPMEQTLEHGVKQGDENELTVPDGDENKYNLRIKLPNILDAENGDWVYVRHIKEDGTVYYDEAVVVNGAIRIATKHGFSEFDISTDIYDEDPTFYGKSLLLGDKIGVAFYMNIPKNDEAGKMQFKVSGKGGFTTSADGTYDKSNGCYKYVCYLNALQMADKITATYFKGDYKTIEEYSVVDYLTRDVKEFGTSKMKTLAKKIYSYGYYAQKYLSQKNGFTLGTSSDSYMPMDAPAPTEIPDTTKDLSKYAAEISANGSTDFEQSASASLTLDSDVGLKIYMSLTNGSSYNADNKPVITVDGEELDPSKINISGKNMEISIDNIPALRLGHKYNVVIGGTYTIKLSALTYANALKNNAQDGDFAKELAVALYEYYEATAKYAN